MKYTFGEHGDENGARATKIRALFHGGSIAAHTEYCIDHEVWTESELRAKAVRACKEEVRSALSAVLGGLPWAGETPVREEGKPVWRQLSFWDYEIFVYNIELRKTQTGADLVVINRMIQRCLEKFGRAPKKTAVIEVEDEPGATTWAN